jgi:hypothetical protein
VFFNVVFQVKVNFAGGCPAANYFSCLAKKSNQKKSPPVYRPCGVPCVARLTRRLRNSHDPLRVHVLKQPSPKSPDQPPLLGGAQGKEKLNCKFKILNSTTDAALARHLSVIDP